MSGCSYFSTLLQNELENIIFDSIIKELRSFQNCFDIPFGIAREMLKKAPPQCESLRGQNNPLSRQHAAGELRFD
jgi:hypothetical protein